MCNRQSAKVDRKFCLGMKTVGSFGVALSGLFVTHDLQADVLDITWNGGNNQASAQYPGNTFADLDQLEGTENLRIFQFLSMYTNVAACVSTYSTLYRILRFDNALTVSLGMTLDPDTFEPFSNFAEYFGTLPETKYIGFRTPDGNVGWFKIDVDGHPGPIAATVGEIATEGETLVVGGTILMGDVNCDNSVDLLDVQPFIELLQSGKYLDKADFNFDGVVSLLDVPLFVDAILPPSIPTVALKGIDLHIDGTTADDHIEILGPPSGQLQVIINKQDFGSFVLFPESSIVINANDGNDDIQFQASIELDAVVDGGLGNDTIRTGAGNDQIDGGIGDDMIFARAGIDLIQGGFGNDIIYGHDGPDVIEGGQNNDTVIGGSGNDTLAGNSGEDSLDGGSGEDTALDFGEVLHQNIENNPDG